MAQLEIIHFDTTTLVSPMILSDRLIALARAADGAGYTGTAVQLLSLAHSVFDEYPRLPN